MLRILYDDFDQKVKNIHDKMDIYTILIKKACILETQGIKKNTTRILCKRVKLPLQKIAYYT